MTLFHIAPRFIRAEPHAIPVLLDVQIPELDLCLLEGTDLRLCQVGINPKNLTVCRAAETPATHGFLLSVKQPLSALTVRTRYRLHKDHGAHTVIHESHHPLLDSEFESYSTDPRLLDPASAHGFGSRWPGAWGNVLALTPLMQVYPDKRSPESRFRPLPAQDTNSTDLHPVILQRKEQLSLPSIETERLFAGVLKLMPKRNSEFTID